MRAGTRVRGIGAVGGTSRSSMQPAEGALVDEAQLGPAVGETDPDVQMVLVGRVGGPHQQLPAHAEMRDQRLVRGVRRGVARVGAVGTVERQPRYLPAPRAGRPRAAPGSARQIGGAAGMAPDRPRMPDLDAAIVRPD